MNAKPNRRWYQFSLKTLLLALTLLCLGPGGYLVYEQSKARRQKAIVEAIEELGGKTYVWDETEQKWILRDESFGNVKSVLLNYTEVTEAELVGLASLPRLTHLSLDNTQLNDAGLVPIGKLRKLGCLSLKNTRVTDAGISHIAGLVELRQLSLEGTQVTNVGVGEIQRALPNCKIVLP